VAQCEGKTKKGDRCRRDASADSSFCTIHQDQGIRARETREPEEWDHDAILKAALGFALVGVLLLLRFRR
jgi:hypothetical protein